MSESSDIEKGQDKQQQYDRERLSMAKPGSLESSASEASGSVYPLYLLDDFKGNYYFVSAILRFDDVLDADKLADALSRLLEIDDWKKLGGRLQFKKNGKLEIRVPSKFTKDQLAITFTQDKHLDTGIDDHPLARHLPKPTDGPSVQAFPDRNGFPTLAVRPGFPTTIQEMVNQDIPQLSVHVTSFNNATLVSLAWPHVLMDAMGLKALLQAWSLVLADRNDEVSPVHGARDDLLSVVDILSEEQQKQEHVLTEWRRGFLALIQLLAMIFWAKLWKPLREHRVIFLPKESVQRLRSEAQQQGDSEEFVSDGDLLCAWLARAVARALSKPRPITAIQLLNARFRLPWLQMTEGVLIQNVVMPTFSFISPEMASGPLGPTARALRHQLAEQAAESQVTLFLKQLRQEVQTKGKPHMMYGENGAMPIFFNNLTKAGYINVTDFSPAVVPHEGKDVEAGAGRAGRPVTYFHQLCPSLRTDMVDFVNILGKDHEENYWLLGTISPDAWKHIEEDVGRWQARDLVSEEK